MPKTCKGEFWLNNPAELFCSLNVIPTDNMTLQSQLNAITRLILIISIILLIFNVRNSIIFLVTTLVITIITFYTQKKNYMEKYNSYNSYNRHRYEPTDSRCGIFETKNERNFQPPLTKIQNPSPRSLLSLNGMPVNKSPLDIVYKAFPQETDFKVQTEGSNLFCNSSVLIQPDQNFKSSNFRLQNQCEPDTAPYGANPKTRKAPIVSAPIYATDYWLEDNVVPSFINGESNTDIYRSGYIVSNCCGDVEGKVMQGRNICNNSDEDEIVEGFKYDTFGYPEITPNSGIYSYPYKSSCNKEDFDDPIYYDNVGTNGDINVSCCYDPSQFLESNIPNNVPAGSCDRSENLDCYNKKLFTNIIQPGVYSVNEVVEQPMSNLGISFTQQFQPVTCESKDGNEITYINHDPRIIREKEEIEIPEERVTESDVYDGRLYGYGTSYRSYVDPQLGQPKFYYDDINSVRRPNYIIRSKVDVFPWADSYGPVKPMEERNKSDFYNRSLANDEFLRNTIAQRTDLQERLMRKYNASAWQKKVAPLSRASASSVGRK